jgi:hypothetical protein
MYKTEGEAESLWLFSHIEIFRSEFTSKFHYTMFSVAIAEMSLDILLSKLKLILKLLRMYALGEYLNLHNKAKKCTCAKYAGN